MPINVIKTGHLTAHTGSVYSLCNGSNPDDIYSSGGDGMLIRWNLQLPDYAYLAARVPAHIFSMLLLSENMMLLGQMHGNIHVIDLSQKKEIKNLAFHKKGLFDLQQISNSRCFLAAGGDGIVSLWETDHFTLLTAKQLSDKSIRSLTIDAKRNTIYAGCSDHAIYVLDLNTLQPLHKWQAHRNSVFSLCLSPCGSYLLSGSRDAYFSIWSVQENFRLLLSQPAHLFTINHIVYSPDSQFVATAGRDKHIKIWDAKNFTLQKVISREKQGGHTHSVNRLLWRRDVLISCSDDRTLMLWKIEVVENN